jgi:hypothetical protein
MAWVTPPTFTTGNVLTAAQVNILAGDLMETAAAKASSTGDLFTSTQYFAATAANSLTARQAGSGFKVDADTTTSTALGDLAASVGPAVTVTSGARAVLFMNSTVQNTNVGVASSVGYAVSGATTIAASQIYISLLTAAANQQATMTGVRMETALTPGANTFTMKYVVGAGTGTFSRRYLTVMPF